MRSNLQLESTTIWSFPERGKWATHNSRYRGNFAPQVAQNLILKYSKERELIVDPMVGSGTSLIEARLHNRHAIGVDINPTAVALAKKALRFEVTNKSRQEVILGSAKRIDILKDSSVSFVIMHPPYLDIIKYSKGEIFDDLSNSSDTQVFLDDMALVGSEGLRVLKPGRHCAVLIGDVRRKGEFIPLGNLLMSRFLELGFEIREHIIKLQHNCLSTPKWIGRPRSFYLLAHEHLFIFRKPKL